MVYSSYFVFLEYKMFIGSIISPDNKKIVHLFLS